MDITIINQILPFLYAAVAVVIIWLIIELVLTIRKTRKVVDEVQKTVNVAVQDVDEIKNELMPAIKKVDPLMDRVSLSVDAVNLELLRVDEIMTDVKTMSSAAAGATKSINTVASAPVDFVSGVADKVRRHFGPKAASKESMRIGAAKADVEQSAVNKLVDALDDAVDGSAE